jgi:hypothetical protein
VRRVKRWAILGLLATTAVFVVGAGGSSARTSADLFSGTWNLTAAAGTLWASGGTLTISAASSSAVPGATGQAAWDAYVKGYCTGPAQPGGTAPRPSAWYSLHYSWSGGGTMGGCVSDKTNGQLIFFGQGTLGHVQGRNGNMIFGDWTNNPNGSTRFSATLAAAGGGGGGATPVAGATKTVPEPAPGTSVSFSSPHPLPTTCSTAAFRAPASSRGSCFANAVVSGDLNGTTVAAEGGVTRGKLVGQLVAECWMLYEFDSDEPLTAKEQLAWCLVLVKAMISRYFDSHPAFPATPAPAIRLVAASAAETVEAGGCHAQRLAFDVRGNKTRISSLKRVAARPSATSVLYRCSASAGTMKINIDGRVPGGLRKALGPKLDLKVIRSKKAPKQGGKLKFTFGW